MAEWRSIVEGFAQLAAGRGALSWPAMVGLLAELGEPGRVGARALMAVAEDREPCAVCVALGGRRFDGTWPVPEHAHEAVVVEGWRQFAEVFFPETVTAGFADHHVGLWEWFAGLQLDVRPNEAAVAAWARGGAKSSSVELGVVHAACMESRRYCLYVSASQDRADDHVESIAGLLENPLLTSSFPAVGERALSKFGQSRGWRRNRLHTRSGFIVDALGLDTASRGAKVGNVRPDLLVLDDFDDDGDSARVTEKKLRTITRRLIPAGARSLAVVAIQNLIFEDSIMSQLVSGGATFLRSRKVFGPIPALLNFHAEYGADGELILEGTPTWAGQDLDTCRSMILDMGLEAFTAECQHDLSAKTGALFTAEILDATRVESAPDLVAIGVGLDPPAKSHGAEAGVIAVGLGADGHLYVLDDRSLRGLPADWATAAVECFHEWNATTIVAETNMGGDMVRSVVSSVDPNLPIHEVNASRGKRLRAEDVSRAFSERRAHIVGKWPVLERQLTRWDGTGDSPDRMDAMAHAANWALGEIKKPKSRTGLSWFDENDGPLHRPNDPYYRGF